LLDLYSSGPQQQRHLVSRIMEGTQPLDASIDSLKSGGWEITDVDPSTGTVFASHEGNRWVGSATCSVKYVSLTAKIVQFDIYTRTNWRNDDRVKTLVDRFENQGQPAATNEQPKT